MRAALLALAAAALAALAAGGAAASQRAAPTSLGLYSPYAGAAVAPGVRIDKTAPGYCWTGSSSTARADAFRCFVGNEIYDPCFADRPPAKAGYVLCPLLTPGAAVLRIDLTKRLPANPQDGDPMRYAPWALETAAGGWCTLITGASGSLDGLPIRYECAGGALALGDPLRSQTSWTIAIAASTKVRHPERVAVRAAWW